MDHKAMLRHFRGQVVLGLPQSPLSYLKKIRREYGGRPHVFIRRCPLWLRLFPIATVHISAAGRHAEILLLELSDFAEKNKEKQLTLIPATAQAVRFVEEYRKALDPLYMIRVEH